MERGKTFFHRIQIFHLQGTCQKGWANGLLSARKEGRNEGGVLLKKDMFLPTTLDKNGMKRIYEMMKSLKKNENDVEEGKLSWHCFALMLANLCHKIVDVQVK